MAGYHTWCAALSSVALCCAALSMLWCIAVKAAAAVSAAAAAAVAVTVTAAGAAAVSAAFRLHSLPCNCCCSARPAAPKRCLPLQPPGSFPPGTRPAGCIQTEHLSVIFCRPPRQVCLPLHLLHRQPGHGGASRGRVPALCNNLQSHGCSRSSSCVSACQRCVSSESVCLAGHGSARRCDRSASRRVCPSYAPDPPGLTRTSIHNAVLDPVGS